jgi:hypothetical protein
MTYENGFRPAQVYREFRPKRADYQIGLWANRSREIATEQEQEHGPCTDEFPRKQVSESDQ